MTFEIFTKKKEHVSGTVKSACDDNSQNVEVGILSFSYNLGLLRPYDKMNK